jgi:hypothetical protein
MSPHGVPGLRVLEVLFAAGDDLVVDDRTDSLTVWIDAKFASLPPRMRDELDTWITVLRHGTPRRRARPRITVFTLLAAAHPFLTEIADRYTTLRQVTRQDVLDWLDDRKHRTSDAHALRDLFGVLKAQRLVFANPLTRIHIGSANPSTPAALTGEALHAIGDAAKNDPTCRPWWRLSASTPYAHIRSAASHSTRSIYLTSASTWAPPDDAGPVHRRSADRIPELPASALAGHRKPPPPADAPHRPRTRTGQRLLAHLPLRRLTGHRRPAPRRPHPGGGTSRWRRPAAHRRDVWPHRQTRPALRPGCLARTCRAEI